MRGRMREGARVLLVRGFPLSLKLWLVGEKERDGVSVRDRVVGLVRDFKVRVEGLKDKKGLFEGMRCGFRDCDAVLQMKDFPVGLSDFLHDNRKFAEIREQVIFIIDEARRKR